MVWRPEERAGKHAQVGRGLPAGVPTKMPAAPRRALRPWPWVAAAGELKSSQGSDELVKLLLERIAELEAAKAALVLDGEAADVREKIGSSRTAS